MRDDDHGLAVLGFFLEHVQALGLLHLVHVGGGFVEQEHIGVGEHEASEGDQLALTAAQAFAAFADGAVEPQGVGEQEAAHAGALHDFDQGVVARVGQTDEQVFAQGALEQAVLLLQVAHVAVDDFAADVREVEPVDQDAAFVGHVHATEQAQQRGFARSDGADDAHAFTGLDLQRVDDERCRAGAVGKLDLLCVEVPAQIGGDEHALQTFVVGLEVVELVQALQGGLGVGVLNEQAWHHHDG